MVRKITRSAVCFAVGLLAISLGVGALNAEDKKDVPSIEDIMSKSYSGKDKSLQKKIVAAAKAEKWDDAQKFAAEYKTLGAALGSNTVDKGDAASWKKLSAKYAKSTADVAAAAEKKDTAAVTKAIGAVNCKECHHAHK